MGGQQKNVAGGFGGAQSQSANNRLFGPDCKHDDDMMLFFYHKKKRSFFFPLIFGVSFYLLSRIVFCNSLFSRLKPLFVCKTSSKPWEALGGAGRFWEPLGGPGRIWETLSNGKVLGSLENLNIVFGSHLSSFHLLSFFLADPLLSLFDASPLSHPEPPNSQNVEFRASFRQLGLQLKVWIGALPAKPSA